VKQRPGKPRPQGGRRGRPARGRPHSPARLAALNAALLSQKRGVPVSAALEEMCADGRIGERDRRLAEEIAYGAVRHRASIDAVIGEVSSMPLARIETAVLEALRGAVYQTFYLTRVPEHAAVDEAVRLARSFAGRKSAGFTNAVLRAALELRAGRGRGQVPEENRRAALAFRGGEYLFLNRPLLPDPGSDPAGWLAAHYSYPRWLVERLIEEHGRGAAEAIFQWGNEVPPVTVRVNPLRAEVRALAGREPKELCAAGEIFSGCSWAARGELPGCYRLKPDRPVGGLSGLRGGLFTVQDGAQQRAAALLAPGPGEKVLDLCAAPGGKATQLAELAGDRAEILACDADAGRLELVTEAAARLGLRSIATRVLEVPPLPAELAGQFGAVLADVPCSNTGAMNRRVEARWRARPEAVAALAGRQRGILGAALAAARPGGRALYATCSLLAAENGEVVRAVLASREGVRLVSEETILPRAGLGDGAYLALLEA